MQKLSTVAAEEAVIPSNIQPHVFTNLAWDNIDRLEETISGGGTSHRVNGLAVQRKVYGPENKTNLAKTPKSKKRSWHTRKGVLSSLKHTVAEKNMQPLYIL